MNFWQGWFVVSPDGDTELLYGSSNWDADDLSYAKKWDNSLAHTPERGVCIWIGVVGSREWAVNVYYTDADDFNRRIEELKTWLPSIKS